MATAMTGRKQGQQRPAQRQRAEGIALPSNRRENINARIAEGTADKARAGDTDAALEILREFVAAVDQSDEQTWHGPVQWAYARYLADAFEKIIRAAMRSSSWQQVKWSDADSGPAQADANLALGIKSSKSGRRVGTKFHNQEALAAAYWHLIRKGWRPERASSALSERTGANRRTIQKASVANGNDAFKDSRLISDESLKVLFAPYAAVIKAILAVGKKR